MNDTSDKLIAFGVGIIAVMLSLGVYYIINSDSSPSETVVTKRETVQQANAPIAQQKPNPLNKNINGIEILEAGQLVHWLPPLQITYTYMLQGTVTFQPPGGRWCIAYFDNEVSIKERNGGNLVDVTPLYKDQPVRIEITQKDCQKKN